MSNNVDTFDANANLAAGTTCWARVERLFAVSKCFTIVEEVVGLTTIWRKPSKRVLSFSSIVCPCVRAVTTLLPPSILLVVARRERVAERRWIALTGNIAHHRSHMRDGLSTKFGAAPTSEWWLTGAPAWNVLVVRTHDADPFLPAHFRRVPWILSALEVVE